MPKIEIVCTAIVRDRKKRHPPSLPRKRESTPLRAGWKRLDSRFRGNDTNCRKGLFQHPVSNPV